MQIEVRSDWGSSSFTLIDIRMVRVSYSDGFRWVGFLTLFNFGIVITTAPIKTKQE